MFKKKIVIILIILIILNLAVYKLFLKNYYPLSFFVENPSVLQTAINWTNLSLDEKKVIFLQDISCQLKENKTINQEIEKNLLTNYQEYINNYIQYLNGYDYLNTILSTRYTKFLNEKKANNNNYLAIVGRYDNIDKEITINTYKSLFHEKIHADRAWGVSGLKNDLVYEEAFTSIITKDNSYEDIKALFHLIGELTNKEEFTRCIFTKNYSKIWDNLKQEYPNFKEKITKLEQLVKDIFNLEYIEVNKGSLLTINSLKNEFLNTYEKLFYNKYKYNTDNDIIITYLKYSLFFQNIFKNENPLNYQQFKITEGFYYDSSNRQGIFEEVLIKYIVKNKNDTTKYSYLLWRKLTKISDNTENKYQQFLNTYQQYFSAEEINEIFNQILNCNADNYENNLLYLEKMVRWHKENNNIY